MTIVPDISISSIERRIASVAARSASIRSPRPIIRADAIAAASVTRTISSASSCSMSDGSLQVADKVVAEVPTVKGLVVISLVAEVPAAGEDHGHVVPVGDLDGHLV